MTHEELEGSVPLYAAGALDRTERQALEAHLLSGCSACHSALKGYQSVAALLPLSLSPIKPPQSLKSKIMAERGPAPIPVEPTPKPEPARYSGSLGDSDVGNHSLGNRRFRTDAKNYHEVPPKRSI